MSEENNLPLSSIEILRMAARVAEAYVSFNTVSGSELVQVIQTVHQSLSELNNGRVAEVEPEKPAVPLRRSITGDYLVCLECGAKLKMLKRHLRTDHGFNPDEYRSKWSLPNDYPMVAPNYAKQRSDFAKQIGLGRTEAKHRPGRRSRKKAV